MRETAILFMEVAAGIVLGFMVFSYVAPILTPSTSVTPAA